MPLSRRAILAAASPLALTMGALAFPAGAEAGTPADLTEDPAHPGLYVMGDDMVNRLVSVNDSFQLPAVVLAALGTPPGTAAGQAAAEAAANSIAGLVLTPETYGAVGNGTTDDTTAITALFAAVTNGATIAGQSGKTYLYTTALSLADKTDVTIRDLRLKFTGSAASTSGSVRALTFGRCHRLRLQGVTVDVTNQAQQYTGIQVQGITTGVVIDGCAVNNARWVGISVFDSGAASPVGAVVRNSTATLCRFGLYTNATGTVVTGGTYSNTWAATAEYTAKAGVWDSTSIYWDGIIVGGSGWRLHAVSASGNGQSGVYGDGTCRDGEIIGGTYDSNFNKGVDLGAVGAKTGTNYVGRCRVVGVGAKNNKTGNIHFDKADDCVVSATTTEMPSTIDYPCIIFNGLCTGNSIVGNTVKSAAPTQAGIFINQADAAAGNVIVGNNVAAPVGLKYSANRALNTVLDPALTPPTPPAQATKSGTYAFTYPAAGVGSSGALGNGSLRLSPWWVSEACTITRIGADISIVGSAGALLRLGIYADDGTGYPGARVLDAGTLDGTVVAVSELTVSQVLQPGLYWVGGAVQGNPTTQPTVRIPNIPPYPPLFRIGSTIPAAGVFGYGYVELGTATGALPATFTTTVTIASGVPRVFVKYS